MKKENILWGIIAIGLLIAIISPFLPSFDKGGNLLSKVQTTLSSKSPFDKYKIDISTGKTETEKTMIVKFNNIVDKIIEGANKSDKEKSANDAIIYLQYVDDFNSYLSANITNISNSLFNTIKTNTKGLASEIGKYLEKSNSISNEKTDNEIVVDLNDYFNSSTGWDDETDWNCTGIEDEESQKAFDKVLKKNGIYYSSKKGAWVKKKSKAKSIEEQTVKVEF